MLQEMLTGRKPSAIATTTRSSRFRAICRGSFAAVYRRSPHDGSRRPTISESRWRRRFRSSPGRGASVSLNRLLTMAAVAVAATAMGTAIGWALFRARPALALVSAA